jgi:hypothetical protein
MADVLAIQYALNMTGVDGSSELPQSMGACTGMLSAALVAAFTAKNLEYNGRFRATPTSDGRAHMLTLDGVRALAYYGVKRGAAKGGMWAALLRPHPVTTFYVVAVDAAGNPVGEPDILTRETAAKHAARIALAAVTPAAPSL